jgi:hypothetical protein
MSLAHQGIVIARFTKALDHIKSIRKEQNVNLKVDQERLTHLKVDRDKSGRVSCLPSSASTFTSNLSSRTTAPRTNRGRSNQVVAEGGRSREAARGSQRVDEGEPAVLRKGDHFYCHF